VSSAEGSGSDNPFAGYDVLPVLDTRHHQSDDVFHFLDGYVESVCIEEQQQSGDDDVTWSEEPELTNSDVLSGPIGSSVVGVTPEELESFNELIKFDHMYSRQPVKDICPSEESLNQSGADCLVEVLKLASCKEEEEEIAVPECGEELSLASLSESDLAQLTSCLDWLIDSSDDVLTECKTSVYDCQAVDDMKSSLDDLESECLPEHIDSISCFTNGSFVSESNFDCSLDKHNSINNLEESLVEGSFFDSGLNFNSTYSQISKELAVEAQNTHSSESDSCFIESLKNCTSPCSSSGCESDFSSTTYDDEPFSFVNDIAFTDFSHEPFTDLFPALY